MRNRQKLLPDRCVYCDSWVRCNNAFTQSRGGRCLSDSTDARWTKSSNCYQWKYRLLVASGGFQPASSLSMTIKRNPLKMLIKATSLLLKGILNLFTFWQSSKNVLLSCYFNPLLTAVSCYVIFVWQFFISIFICSSIPSQRRSRPSIWEQEPSLLRPASNVQGLRLRLKCSPSSVQHYFIYLLVEGQAECMEAYQVLHAAVL